MDATCRFALLRFALVVSLGISRAAWISGQDTPFRRGDSNGDLQVDLSDAVFTLGFLFLGDPPRLPCEDAADADDDGILDLTDAVFGLSFSFLGGRAPPEPFPSCGPDAT